MTPLTIHDGHSYVIVDTDPGSRLPYLDVHNAGEHVARIQLSARQATELATALDLRRTGGGHE